MKKDAGNHYLLVAIPKALAEVFVKYPDTYGATEELRRIVKKKIDDVVWYPAQGSNLEEEV